MIICASRRTDIPAFHSEWFMNRIRSGYVLVRNPACKQVVYRINLDPENVDCFIFITKNPQPMEKYLDELNRLGYEYLFQVTINPYGKDVEPNVPDRSSVIDSFIRISERIGKERMIWRYDPVFFNDSFDIGFHEMSFESMCSKLQGHTGRVVFSFLDVYQKLNKFMCDGTLREVTGDEKKEFSRMISKISSGYGIDATTCCTVDDMMSFGVSKRGCIDEATMRYLNIPYEIMTTPLRDGCLCVKNIDIGAYDTCCHNCIYCYANSENTWRFGHIYDENSEMLFGKLSDGDILTPMKRRVNSTLTRFL